MKLLKKDRRNDLEKEIDRLLMEMSLIEDQTSDTYKQMEASLEKLIAAKTKLYPSKEAEKLNPNTVLSIFGEVGVTLMILNYERLHIIASKAFSRIWRGRV